MVQAVEAINNQQKGTGAGASGDGLGAPFSLSALSKSALTHHQQAGDGTAFGSRTLDQGGPPDIPSPPSMDREADATGGLCIGRICADTVGAWGLSAINKLRRVYTGVLLATTINT